MTKKVVAVTENWQISHVIANDSMSLLNIPHWFTTFMFF